VKLTVILSFFVALILISSAAYADDPITVGKAALDRGDYPAAIAAFREAVDKNSKNPQAFILLGTACLKGDSLDAAVAALIQGRELDTANAQFYLLLGDVYAKQKIFVAAAEQYKKASLLDGKNLGTFLKLGDAERRSHQYNDAITAFQNVLAIDSNNVTALTEIGNIFMRARRYVNAVPVYERLIRLEPDSMNVQLNYAKVLFETKSYQKFIPVGEAISKKDASQTEVQSMLANAYSILKLDSLTVQQYEKLKIDTLGVDNLLRYAKALKAVDKIDKSLEIFQRAYTKDSTRCDIPYDFGTTYMKVKKYQEAIRMFDKKIACDTSAGYQFASHLNEAMSLMQLKNFRDAQVHIQKSIQYRPDNVQAWLVLAQDYGQLEMTDDEVSSYKKVIDLVTALSENADVSKYNSQMVESYRMVGVRYLIKATQLQKVGDEKLPEAKKTFAASVDFLKKALQYTPKDCQVMLWIAQASQNSGSKEEAKRYYCKVLQQCPDSKEAKDAQSGLDALGVKCGE